MLVKDESQVSAQELINLLLKLNQSRARANLIQILTTFNKTKLLQNLFRGLVITFKEETEVVKIAILNLGVSITVETKETQIFNYLLQIT